MRVLKQCLKEANRQFSMYLQKFHPKDVLIIYHKPNGKDRGKHLIHTFFSNNITNKTYILGREQWRKLIEAETVLHLVQNTAILQISWIFQGICDPEHPVLVRGGAKADQNLDVAPTIPGAVPELVLKHRVRENRKKPILIIKNWRKKLLICRECSKVVQCVIRISKRVSVFKYHFIYFAIYLIIFFYIFNIVLFTKNISNFLK